MDESLDHLTPDEQEALWATFQSQAGELLDAINEGLLQLEGGRAEPRLLQGLRRAMHTLKGDAGAFGLASLVRVAHQMEDLLQAVVEGQATLDRDRLSLLFRAADTCERFLRGKGEPAAADPEVELLLESLAPPPGGGRGSEAAPVEAGGLGAGGGEGDAGAGACAPMPEGEIALTEYESVAAAEAEARGLSCYHLRAEVDPRCRMPGAGAFLLWRHLQGAGEILRFDPSPEAEVPPGCTEFTVLLASALDGESLERRSLLPGIVAAARALLLPAGAGGRAPGAGGTTEARTDATADHGKVGTAVPRPSTLDPRPQNGGGAPPAVLGASTILVDTRRIDRVMNLVGELVIARSMFHQAFADLQARFPKADFLAGFREAQRLMDRSLADLQKGVMKIRMVPIDRVFRRLPRLVRDLADASQGRKAVHLAMEGGATELDKGIVDALGEPLVHLIRNAVDHGIEPSAERQDQGKPAAGTVRVSARAEGNQIVIEVADDGRGIDPARIRRAAVSRGLRRREEVDTLSDAQALDLIFCPGFSTTDQVTDTSGRGIGMDAVRAALEGLTGHVAVASRMGHGTLFTLRVPLTLAIMRAMRFRAAGRLFALPLSTIAEIARVAPEAVRTVDGHEVLPLRDRVISLIRLAEALGLPDASGGRGPGAGGRGNGTPADGPQEPLGLHEGPNRPPTPDPRPRADAARRLYVLVVALADQRVGLVVEELQGEGELVIKALDAEWTSRSPVAGAAILGDGRVVLILDPAALMEQARERARSFAERGMRNAEYRPSSPLSNPQPGTRHPQPAADGAGARP